MKSTRTFSVTITVLVFLAIFSAGCGSPATSPNTNTTTPSATSTPAVAACNDTKVTSDVGDALKANTDIWAEHRTINYFSKACVVYLQGGVTSLALYQKVIGVVSKVNGVKGLDISRFQPSEPSHPGSGGCPADMKPCGDICIPKDDQCNIGADIAGKTPMPTTSKTP